MLSMKMIFTPEQKILMIEPYFRNGQTHFEKVAVFSGSARSKVRTKENIETVECQMEDPNYLSGNCRIRLSYQC
jgi:hypothetical protein